MKISTKGKYALSAMLFLASQGENNVINVGIVSEKTDISQKYLEQLFLSLRKSGLIDTVRGPNGGYKIKKAIKDINALDIVLAVEGDISPVKCISTKKNTCSRESFCVTKGLWKELSEEINKTLNGMTLEQLLKLYNLANVSNKSSIEYFI